MYYNQVYEEWREMLGEEAKDTLATFSNVSIVNYETGNYQAALDCNEQCQ